ncbi:MAG TPA: YceH family protein [Thermodesulfovibrionales bacterium]|nr:YceH family protein [Thermodesulfovibrionales bacterium]
MDMVLDDVEVRILGCLIEKEMTTPEYYPLSLNALVNACNQKSNRTPVVSYDDSTVNQGLDRLLGKKLVLKTFTAGSRVQKYLHTLLDKFDLSRQELAVLCNLMLRGPETIGETRSHTERMTAFESLEEVEQTLNGLMEHDPALVMILPREPGKKESRYFHMLAGPEYAETFSAGKADELTAGMAGRIARLEEEMATLRGEIDGLRQTLDELKQQN